MPLVALVIHNPCSIIHDPSTFILVSFPSNLGDRLMSEGISSRTNESKTCSNILAWAQRGVEQEDPRSETRSPNELREDETSLGKRHRS